MSLFRSDETDMRKKAFHFESVSVPIDVPPRPDETYTYNIPFGPPVIHVEPEKTGHLVWSCQKMLNEGSSSSSNPFFFCIDGPSIIPPGFEFEFNEKMEEEKEEMKDE